MFESDEEENEYAQYSNWQDIPEIEHEQSEDGETFGLSQSVEFFCGACGSLNYIEFDASGGMHQEIIQDCENCCRPNKIVMSLDGDSGQLISSSTTDI